jgi:peptidoglycan hydrolase-like protein with peptidoglycan-binding domain
MDKNDFIQSIKIGALKGQSDFGILASITIAQAILESGWGKSQLAVKAKNLFGIKAFSNWTGKRVTMKTTEWYNGKRVMVNADFRAYNSIEDSIEDHNKLLSHSRYKPVRQCKDYKAACLELYNCGYATDACYPEKLINIIEDNELYALDSENSLKEAAVDIDTQKISKFQQLCNALGITDSEGKRLAEDNILGPRTKSCIRKMPMLMVGSKGAAVRFIQEMLKSIPVDGEFGHITRYAVMEYQEVSGIKVDGIVGRVTWNHIITK